MKIVLMNQENQNNIIKLKYKNINCYTSSILKGYFNLIQTILVSFLLNS